MSSVQIESRATYLQQQRLRLQTQLQQAQVRQAAAEAEVERHLPAVEQAVAAIRRDFVAQAAQAATAVLRRARRRAWWPALLLRPLLPDWRWRLALLLFLLLALPWMSAHWFGDAHGYLDWWRLLGVRPDTLQVAQRALPSLLLYALLVIGGAQLLARHVSHDERALLAGFAQRPLALMQFAGDDATTMPIRTASPAPPGRCANCRAAGGSPRRTATCPARACWRCTTAPNRSRTYRRCWCCPTAPMTQR